jgi:hypothetical protein
VTRRFLVRLSVVVFCAGGSILAPAGCSNSIKPAEAPLPSVETGRGGDSVSAVDDDRQKAVLQNILQLLRDAATNPEGQRVDIAANNLNHYFESTPRERFKLSESTRALMMATPILGGGTIPEQGLLQMESPQFTQHDGRHIEDCLLYHAIASRVAKDGDDITRVRRIFDWVVRNISLVPPNSLSPPGVEQAKSRPYDVLLRGMATELSGSDWAERSWVFIALCRQIGVDVGLIAFDSKPQGQGAEPPVPIDPAKPQPSSTQIWICGAAIEDKLYLFDAALGLPIPGPGGQGIATLEQAATDPSILKRLDILEHDGNYMITSAELAANPITILMDSSSGFLSTRMKLLQPDLTGRDRMVVYRDPVEQAAAYKKALGARFGKVSFWSLPLEVQYRLFNDGAFVQSAIYALHGFEAELPLLHARIAQLRGDLLGAKRKYVEFRFAPLYPMNNKEKTPIPQQVQKSLLDPYATYFLALAHLENGGIEKATFLFQQALEVLPPATPGAPPNAMLRFGAWTNLGMIYEANGDYARAVRYYARRPPTTQFYGNLLRARELIWRDPMAIPPPEPTSESAKAAVPVAEANAAQPPAVGEQKQPAP